MTDAKALTEALGIYFAGGHELSISKKQESDYAAFRKATAQALQRVRALHVGAMWAKDLANAETALQKVLEADLAQSSTSIGSAENNAAFKQEQAGIDLMNDTLTDVQDKGLQCSRVGSSPSG